MTRARILLRKCLGGKKKRKKSESLRDQSNQNAGLIPSEGEEERKLGEAS